MLDTLDIFKHEITLVESCAVMLAFHFWDIQLTACRTAWSTASQKLISEVHLHMNRIGIQMSIDFSNYWLGIRGRNNKGMVQHFLTQDFLTKCKLYMVKVSG